MFCCKNENNFINKIHKCILPLIYEMEDATSEDVLGRDESKSIHENNIHTLLIEIHKSVHHIIPPIMRNFFYLKMNQYYLFNIHLSRILADLVLKHYVLKKSSV